MCTATSAPTTAALRIFSYGPFVLSAMCWVGLLHAGTPAIADESGIKGKVLRGPAYPGPEIEGEPNEAPFRAAFHVLDSEEDKVARFESDEEGRFKVLLPPGRYTIVPDRSAPIPFPQRQKKEVTVPKDGFADVTLTFETGMR
jgi:hypothetical protein